MIVGTNRGMYYIDDTPREAYCFQLIRLVGDDPVRLDECEIGTVRVVAEESTVEGVRANLRAWGLATLAAGGYGFGRYEVTMGVLDDDDLVDPRYGHETVDWDGERELVPAGSDGPQRAD